MSNTSPPPSLRILLERVVSERETMNAHAESLDAKAGVILGFAGVLVALGATAQATIATDGIFQAGLVFAAIAAGLAAWVVLPRRYPVLEVFPLRQELLMASESETQLQLLDTQIQMITEVSKLVRSKGSRIRLSVISLAIAAVLVVIGTLTAGGPTNAGESVKPRPSSYPASSSYRSHTSSGSSTGTTAL